MRFRILLFFSNLEFFLLERPTPVELKDSGGFNIGAVVALAEFSKSS